MTEESEPENNVDTPGIEPGTYLLLTESDINGTMRWDTETIGDLCYHKV